MIESDCLISVICCKHLQILNNKILSEYLLLTRCFIIDFNVNAVRYYYFKCQLFCFKPLKSNFNCSHSYENFNHLTNKCLIYPESIILRILNVKCNTNNQLFTCTQNLTQEEAEFVCRLLVGTKYAVLLGFILHNCAKKLKPYFTLSGLEILR